MGLGFLSTPSARRATFIIYLRSVLRWISIHALREEGDYLSSSRALLPTNFYPRPPRGGRPFFMMVILALPGISIHALREEGDVKRSGKIDGAILFLSTPSARRATCFQPMPGLLLSNFYPRPPRGGRPFFMMVILALPGISIHALREEGDVKRSGKIDGAILFLSTPSARRATCFQPMPGLLLSNFYPRPPRGGRLTSAFLSRTTSNFYPRPPRGGRRRHDMADIAASGFLSTPSARRATTHPEPSG